MRRHGFRDIPPWSTPDRRKEERLVPDHLLGRVNATMRLLGLGTMPIGAAVGGALGSLLGLVAVFHLTGVLCLAGAMAVWRTDPEQAT